MTKRTNKKPAAARATTAPRTEAELLEATAGFPQSVVFEGETFHRTFKVGTHIATGLPSAEYRFHVEGVSDDRVWRNAAGDVARD